MVELAVSCVLLNAGFRDGDDGEGVGCGLEWLGVCGGGAHRGGQGDWRWEGVECETDSQCMYPKTNAFCLLRHAVGTATSHCEPPWSTSFLSPDRCLLYDMPSS